jgi:hypothetical protein
MSKFKVGDEVEVLFIDGMGYQGNYKKGMRGKIIFISGKNAKLQDDRDTPHSYWLAFSAIKLAKTKYPNPPLPHCEERIAFARGANIESSITNNGPWCFVADPEWQPHLKYRVKVEKTEDDLQIERLEQILAKEKIFIDKIKKELAELKPTIHY